jgi:hypothetical protein
MKPYCMKPYPTHNPDFNDMGLDEQIEAGCNDFAIEGPSGHIYFGRTENEAAAIARAYEPTNQPQEPTT